MDSSGLFGDSRRPRVPTGDFENRELRLNLKKAKFKGKDFSRIQEVQSAILSSEGVTIENFNLVLEDADGQGRLGSLEAPLPIIRPLGEWLLLRALLQLRSREQQQRQQFQTVFKIPPLVLSWSGHYERSG